MKQIPLIIGAILFSTLFCHQSIGLNLVLFSLLTICILAINHLKTFKNTTTLILSSVYILTAISVFFYGSQLAITANCIAFITFVGHFSESKSSIYVNWLNGLYTTVARFFEHQLNSNSKKSGDKPKRHIDYLQWTKLIGIPLLAVIIFINLYKNGNPVFSDFISKIDFSFINFQWFLFAVLGYYLLFNISKPTAVDPATVADLNTGNNLAKNDDYSEENLKKENQLGLVLLALLNILIVFFLITDVSYLLTIEQLNAPQLSNQVHSGINALIASIVIAIAIILYFFRGNLNYFEANKPLKTLTYIWIALNILLVLSIALKNYQYIFAFGFTYKRIGVVIYLLLTLIGLLSTTIKVNRIKNIWYLMRVNTQAAFVILIVASAINWDSHITQYNLYYAQTTDFNYLINLSENNAFILKDYSDLMVLKGEKQSKINIKYRRYVRSLKANSWQETRFDNFKIH